LVSATSMTSWFAWARMRIRAGPSVWHSALVARWRSGPTAARSSAAWGDGQLTPGMVRGRAGRAGGYFGLIRVLGCREGGAVGHGRPFPCGTVARPVRPHDVVVPHARRRAIKVLHRRSPVRVTLDAWA